ncbi:hypothetical protein BS78_06G257900 [Paspalum vaginatum]|nr:hypothetical protein BS78_06G257900 [Paspalum vaginatum]
MSCPHQRMTSVTPSLPLEYSDQWTRRSREAAGAACGAGERHRRDRDLGYLRRRRRAGPPRRPGSYARSACWASSHEGWLG